MRKECVPGASPFFARAGDEASTNAAGTRPNSVANRHNGAESGQTVSLSALLVLRPPNVGVRLCLDNVPQRSVHFLANFSHNNLCVRY